MARFSIARHPLNLFGCCFSSLLLLKNVPKCFNGHVWMHETLTADSAALSSRCNLNTFLFIFKIALELVLFC